jgi:molecular chaperone DnaK (HSP70)
MEAWEKTKIEFKPSEHESARISLSEVVAADVLGGRSLQACVDKFNRENGSNLTLKLGTAILMPKAQMCSFFNPIVDKTVRHVKVLLNACNSANPVKYIYLVGGFAESEILQSSVKIEFEGRYGLHVIVPMRPQAMVVTGAVLFGLQKGSTIQSRVARYTYGFEHLTQYDEMNPEHKQRFHLTSLKNTPNGKIRYITGVFKALVQQGSKICVSEKHTEEGYTPVDIGQTKIAFHLYSSSSPTSRWVDDAGMTKIGQVTMNCVWGQSSSISMSFGNTEIMATATNETTRNTTVKWDFNSL